VIIATVTALYILFGGGSGWWATEIKALEKSVKAIEMSEPAREEALEVVDYMSDLSSVRTDQSKAVSKELEKLLESYDGDSASIARQLKFYREDSRAFYSQMVQARFQLKENFTAEQWEALFPAAED